MRKALIKPPPTVREELLAEIFDQCDELADLVRELNLPKHLSSLCLEAVTPADALVAVEAVRGYVEELSAECRGHGCFEKTAAARAVVESIKQLIEAVEAGGRV